MLALLAYEYWYVVVAIIAIAIVNFFTLWSGIAIWIASFCFLAHDVRVNRNEDGTDGAPAYGDALSFATSFTVIVVLVALAIPAILDSGNSGYVPCSRATPHGC